MKMKIKILTVCILALIYSGCSDFFDVSTNDMLDKKDSYKDNASISSGLVGLSAKFREVAESHIIVSELLGDLMTPTSNAPDAAWDVFRFKATNGNEFASPKPYYNLIVNCNDYLVNLINYNKKYPDAISANVYSGMVSTALTYRIWAYLQIGKLYGEAYYYDVVHSDNYEKTKFRKLDFDMLIEELIFSMKTGVDGVNGFQKLDWKILVSPIKDNFDTRWNSLAINPEVLLCELYLWNKDYTNAAKTGLNFLNSTGKKYKLTTYTNETSKRNTWWDNIFTAEPNMDETITYAPFDFNLNQTGKLQYYFSSISPNVYYFKPTHILPNKMGSVVVDKESSGLIRSLDMFRMRGSFININNRFEIGKYTLKRKRYEQDSDIHIYRAPEVHLMIAEALSGIGGENNIAAADSIINVGFKSSWENGHFKKPFDAPIYTSALNQVPGIRGRVKLGGDFVRYHVDSLKYPGNTEMEKILKAKREKYVLDSLITEETALELAFEGKRWFTLMRIARNNNIPELLAKQISKKYSIIESSGEVRLYEKWLMDPNNWFIKWDQSKVINNKK